MTIKKYLKLDPFKQIEFELKKSNKIRKKFKNKSLILILSEIYFNKNKRKNTKILFEDYYLYVMVWGNYSFHLYLKHNYLGGEITEYFPSFINFNNFINLINDDFKRKVNKLNSIICDSEEISKEF